MRDTFDMKKLTKLYNKCEEDVLIDAKIWIQRQGAETIITDEDIESPSLILQCYMQLNNDCWSLEHFLRAHKLETTEYVKIVAVYTKYEPNIQLLRIKINDKSNVVPKTNEEGSIYFQKEPINARPPKREKRKLTQDNQDTTEPPNKKHKINHYHHSITEKTLIIQENNSNDNKTLKPLSEQTTNNYTNTEIVLNSTSKRPPLPKLDKVIMNKNYYHDESTNNLVVREDFNSYSDSDEEDDFDLFMQKTNVQLYKIDDPIIGINASKRIFIKDLKKMVPPSEHIRNFVHSKLYMMVNLIATKNITIAGRGYCGFKLIFQGLNNELITLSRWDRSYHSVKQFRINTTYIFHSFTLKLKDTNEIKYNVDLNEFILYFNAKTRIFPVDVDPKKYNLPRHFLFEYTELGLNKQKRPIKFRNIIENIAMDTRLRDSFDGKMKTNQSDEIYPTGINVIGLISDYKWQKSKGQNKLDLVVQYKQFAIHVVAWDINETYAIKKKETIAIINGQLTARSNGVDEKLQIKIGSSSLLIFNPYHQEMSEKIEAFKKYCFKYFSLRDVTLKNKFINAEFKKTSFEKISDVASRHELLQDYYLQCNEILLIKSIDFANDRCPFSLYSTIHNVYVKPGEKNITIKTSNGINVQLENVKLSWNVFIRVGIEGKPEIRAVRGKINYNLMNYFYKETKNIKKLFIEWQENPDAFIRKLEILLMNMEITNIKCVIERKKKQPHITFIDMERI